MRLKCDRAHLAPDVVRQTDHVEEAEWRDELWRQIVTLWQTAMLRLTKLRLRDEVNELRRELRDAG